MGREELRAAIFDTIEYITQMELRVSSKRLILGYFNMSKQQNSPDRARETVQRYTQTEIPSLEEVLLHGRENRMTRLDRLVLAMEREARRFDIEPAEED